MTSHAEYFIALDGVHVALCKLWQSGQAIAGFEVSFQFITRGFRTAPSHTSLSRPPKEQGVRAVRAQPTPPPPGAALCVNLAWSACDKRPCKSANPVSCRARCLSLFASMQGTTAPSCSARQGSASTRCEVAPSAAATPTTMAPFLSRGCSIGGHVQHHVMLLYDKLAFRESHQWFLGICTGSDGQVGIVRSVARRSVPRPEPKQYGNWPAFVLSKALAIHCPFRRPRPYRTAVFPPPQHLHTHARIHHQTRNTQACTYTDTHRRRRCGRQLPEVGSESNMCRWDWETYIGFIGFMVAGLPTC